MRTYLAFIAVTCLLLCGAVKAQTPSVPTLTFSHAEGQTIRKSAGVAYMQLNIASPVGIRSGSLSGGYSGATLYPQGAKSCMIKTYWYTSYFPTGEYRWRMSAIDVNGVSFSKTVTVRLIP